MVPDPQKNHLGQPVGHPLPDWQGARRPGRVALQGRLCRLEALDPARHAEDLHAAYRQDPAGALWTYMTDGPYRSYDDFLGWVEAACVLDDPLYYAVVGADTGRALGRAAFLRIEPEMGCMEVGSIAYAPPLQRTAAATEAMYLMMRYAFDELGYRRYEWKCDALNEPSRRAARRLGFTYEGLFRQAMVYKGRNRDTAWYAMVDRDWPAIRTGFERWLDPGNFQDDGRQKRSLGSLLGDARERSQAR